MTHDTEAYRDIDRQVFVQPREAGLQSTPEAVGRRLQEIWRFRTRLVDELRTNGWNVALHSSGKWHVLSGRLRSAPAGRRRTASASWRPSAVGLSLPTTRAVRSRISTAIWLTPA